jgi:multiple antibiotic resistance protein
MLSDFLTAFVTLFVIVDPIGTAAVFVSLVKNLSAAQAKAIAIKACLIAFLVLLFFTFFGSWLLGHIGISVPAFRVAGGILLFVTAYKMVMHGESAESAPRGGEQAKHIAVFPLAIPLLAGPGCMTATVLISQRMSENGTLYLGVAALVAVQLVALLCLLGAGQVMRLLGDSVLSVLARLFGVLLAALAVQFIADGVHQLFNLAR